MKSFLEKSNAFLDVPLDLRSRLMIVLATLCLIPAFILPLWTMTMFAPQYPNGLRLGIYSHELIGGNNNQDVKEINLLNHYIGMHELDASDFPEFKWIPFFLGVIGLLFLRAAVMGRMQHLVDAAVLYCYFCLFSLWTFGSKLYSYGHNLAPTAAVKVPKFTPPFFGGRQIANFEVYSYPGVASYSLGVVIACLVAAVILAWRDSALAARLPTHPR